MESIANKIYYIKEYVDDLETGIWWNIYRNKNRYFIVSENLNQLNALFNIGIKNIIGNQLLRKVNNEKQSKTTNSI